MNDPETHHWQSVAREYRLMLFIMTFFWLVTLFGGLAIHEDKPCVNPEQTEGE